MSKWSEIYKKQISEYKSLSDFIDSKIIYKKKLIEIVEKYGGKTKKLLEAGCGSGITSIYLGNAGYDVLGIASDPEMIKLDSSIASNNKNSALFEVDDIKTLETIRNQHFDVAFSNGVIEHFSDSDITLIVNRQLSISDYVVISIPSDFFTDNEKIFGDERFMNTEQWKSILSKTKGAIIEQFSFRSDTNTGDKPQFIGFVLSSL
jgi:SAM-dependent methyltransferase